MSSIQVQNVHFLLRAQDEARHCGPCVWVQDLTRLPAPIRVKPEASGCDAVGDDSTSSRLREFISTLLARCLGLSSQKILFHNDSHGRLTLSSDEMRCPEAGKFDFNIAHCENICVVGIYRNGRIGVDIELLRSGGKLPSVRQYLSSAERQRIDALPPDDRPMALYKHWTAKEAFVKAIGHGMAFGLDQVEIRADDGGELSIFRVKGSRQLAAGWNLVHHVVDIDDAEAIVAVVHSA